jgi:hypothetical protein
MAARLTSEKGADVSNQPDHPDLPIWPSGVARLADGVLEVTTGDGLRVAAQDIVEIDIDPPRAGRLSLKLAYRAGLGKHKTSFWVEPQHEAPLRRLVASVQDLATRRFGRGEVLGYRVISVTD